ncbi:MAG TPA: aldolase/citrate lyase family protein [Candidatus Limnocylindrales bacterium]|nr:aldolase/citrate lyase family protein [Candidatus Limnocylindrales bacterium]
MTQPTAPAHRFARGRSRIRERTLAGEIVVGAFVNLASPMSAELLARAGFDWLIVDLEHGAGTEADLLGQLYAIESAGDLGGRATAALVRPQEGTRLGIGRALDLGAEGVMVPRLERIEEVERVVTWLRWPPSGIRGLALGTRGAEQGEVAHERVRELNDRVLGIVQVESGAAVDTSAAIAAIDGVDVLFVGPTDLSHALGVPGRFDDPAFEDALRTVVAACRAHGKAPGILLRRLSDLDRYLEQGFTFVGLGSDGAFVSDGAAGAVAAARARTGE